MLAVNQAFLSLRLRLRRTHLPRQREARKPGEALRQDLSPALRGAVERKLVIARAQPVAIRTPKPSPLGGEGGPPQAVDEGNMRRRHTGNSGGSKPPPYGKTCRAGTNEKAHGACGR